ncbi:hypothetical protein DL991_25830 [Amycolatopsis sp. WAC 01375]|uniref:hypothetical protein n=1 Tax=Amycolatopsis sp. WAC 01375 TaxID=2203194 RepID=UPI000F775E51|nr:hypothetical protein [Amycolatopsis sp. WAC 01375]RSM76607.1 hypothetical protein DL991_25830 [Amycolatopsis sp. WAC 01375]
MADVAVFVGLGGLTVKVTGGGTDVNGVAVTVVTRAGVVDGAGTWFGGVAVQAPAVAKSPEIIKTGHRLMASSARVPS